MSLPPDPANRVRLRPRLRSLLSLGGSALAGMAAAALFSTPPSTTPRLTARTPAPPANPPGGAAAGKQGALPGEILLTGTPFQQLTAALHLGENATAAELRALLENAHRLPSNASRATALGTLLKRWLALEPEAALEFARRRHVELLPELLGTWAATEPAAAEAFLNRLSPEDGRIFAWWELARSVLAHSPETIWPLLNRATAPGSAGPARRMEVDMGRPIVAMSPGPESGVTLDPAILARLVAADPDAVAERFDSLSAGLRAQILGALCREVVKTDPARAWDLSFRNVDSAQLRRELLKAVFPQDPATALQLLGSLHEDSQPAIAYGPMDASSSDAVRELSRLPMDAARLDAMLAVSPEGGGDSGLWSTGKISELITALKHTSGLTENTCGIFAAEAFLGAVAADPLQAARLIPLLPDSAREGALTLLVKSVGAHAGFTDSGWLAELPEPLRAAAGEIRTKQEDEAALRKADETANAAEETARAATVAVSASASESLADNSRKPEGMMAVWLTGEPTPTLGRHLAAMTPAQLDAAWPADAVALPEGLESGKAAAQPPSASAEPLSLPPGLEAPTTRNAAFESLAEENPAAAAAWLRTWTIDPPALAIPLQFVSDWAASDPTAAAAWVQTLRPGPLAETAAANVARGYQRYAPAEAAAWLNRLPEGPAKDAARKAVTVP